MYANATANIMATSVLISGAFVILVGWVGSGSVSVGSLDLDIVSSANFGIGSVDFGDAGAEMSEIGT